ncbi:MAG: dihydrofolate reductase [Treponema sp.]|jgi:dihydrofolate reductase|nr:dihydrofolate reductase [Treponema sp.]
MPEVIIIAAMAENRVIGKDGALPWSLREDMIRFRTLTWGHPCVMGRKPWASLPKKPLPGRLNIVISSQGRADPARCRGEEGRRPGEGRIGRPEGLENEGEPARIGPSEGVLVVPSLGEAIRRCGGRGKVFICGGASVYREALAVAGAIELTLIHGEYDGDAFFPEIDPRLWRKVSSEDYETFSFIRYNKIQFENFGKGMT